MQSSPSLLRCSRGFTLLELLVVIAIAGILLGAAALSLKGINESGKFNHAVGEISGLLEQARAYAIAQNTYVWVAFYEIAPAGNQPLEVYVGSFASNDGTDPFNWAGSVTLPSPGTAGSTTLSPISKLYRYRGLHLQTTTLPQAPATPNLPASAPVFKCTTPGGIALSQTGAYYGVIEFTPTGAAHNAANPIESIWLGLQPSLSPTVLDTHNIASLKISGLTGLTTLNRL